MTRCFARCFLFGVVVILGSVPMRAADCQVLGQLRTQWESTRKLIVAIAEAIPENKYDYRPTPEVRSFREQLAHLVSENHGFMGTVATNKLADFHQFDHLKTRAELLKGLNESYDYGAKVLADLTDEKAMEIVDFRGQKMPRFAIVWANMIDNMDHYGNLVVYLRLNGIVPPKTASRQQQARGGA